VRSYLGAEGLSPRTDALLRAATALDVIVTDSVVEALALENRLIKQRNPRFNILLRDDKTYPYLQLTTTERAPRVLVARRVERDGNVYAGPYMPAALARRTMSLTHRLFGIRSCNEVIDGQRDRPCLEYDIKRCIAPCVESICSIERYRQAADQARLFLEGRQDELIHDLQREMAAAAAEERFEQAAQVRDAVRTIETLRDRHQKIESPSLGDRDAFGIKTGAAGGVVQVFQVRHGRVVDRTELFHEESGPLPGGDARAEPPRADGSPDAEILTSALQSFYAEREPPGEIHVQLELAADEREPLEAWLSTRAGRRVRIVAPRRGEKRGLLELAMRNAGLAYQSRFADPAIGSFDALETLRTLLALPALPRRIECFDISTFQGRETVGSMVVCLDGRMRRGEYRKFRLRGALRAPSARHPAPAPVVLDDFASMQEVVLRRYRRLLERGGPFPDLILIDGGKGQLAAAYAALRDLGLERLVAAGIAKREEIIFTRDRAEGIALPHENAALRLIQRIRDEAHRFAVTFHRRARRMRDFRSALDDIPGVGPRRRKQLLSAFGSLAGVRRASREELEALVGAKTAAAVLRHFGT
jgi:excinuclease ABC subunit C